MKHLLIIAALLLAGCGAESNLPSPIIHGQADTDNAIIEQAWRDTQLCAGMLSASVPVVIVQPVNDLRGVGSVPFTERPVWGVSYATGVIHVGRSEATLSPWSRNGVGATLRHEMLHFLLYALGDIDASNLAHEAELFVRCQ